MKPNFVLFTQLDPPFIITKQIVSLKHTAITESNSLEGGFVFETLFGINGWYLGCLTWLSPIHLLNEDDFFYLISNFLIKSLTYKTFYIWKRKWFGTWTIGCRLRYSFFSFTRFRVLWKAESSRNRYTLKKLYSSSWFY